MQNFKYSIALIYLILFVSLILFLISNYNISDFFSYDFIRLNKEIGFLSHIRKNIFLLGLKSELRIVDLKKKNFLNQSRLKMTNH